MNTGWRCNQCGQIFEPSGDGMNRAMEHGKFEHKMKPSECIDGIVDLETDEILVPKWGPQVLNKAIRMGYATSKAEQKKQEQESKTTDNNAQSQSNVVDLEEKKAKGVKAGRGATTAGVQKMAVLAQNLFVDPIAYYIFLEARARWPERYPDTGSESMSQFMLDCVVVSAMALEMNGAQVIAQSLNKQYGTGGSN